MDGKKKDTKGRSILVLINRFITYEISYNNGFYDLNIVKNEKSGKFYFSTLDTAKEFVRNKYKVIF